VEQGAGHHCSGKNRLTTETSHGQDVSISLNKCQFFGSLTFSAETQDTDRVPLVERVPQDPCITIAFFLKQDVNGCSRLERDSVHLAHDPLFV
jgi:hypothetical protein